MIDQTTAFEDLLASRKQQAAQQSDHTTIAPQPAARITMGQGIKAGSPLTNYPFIGSAQVPFTPQPVITPDLQKLIDAAKQQAINPKEVAGSKKPATWSVMPRWIILAVGRVMSVGTAKYGAFNYRQSPIAASTYQDALERHLGLWFDGEDSDSETGVSHLASAIASCALLMDAQATGKLVDDRQKTGLARKTLDELEALLVTLPLPKSKAH